MKHRIWIYVAISLAGCSFIPGTDDNKIAKGKTLSSNLLLDPSSAQFRNVFIHNVIFDGSRQDVVCGEMNGKNSYGAYAGYSRFIAIGGGAMIDPKHSTTEEEANRLFKRCENSVSTMKRSKNEIDIEMARFECDQAKPATIEAYQQLKFEALYATVCVH